MEEADDPVAVDLTEMERSMLIIGLSDWGGPAYCGDPMAQVLGFKDVEDLYDEGRHLAESIGRGEAQSSRNWTRALASLEVMFGSRVLGSGEWGAVYGYADDDLYAALKALRRKLPISKRHLRVGRFVPSPDHTGPPGGGSQDTLAANQAGWIAYTPGGGRPAVEDPPWEGPREGSVIRFMGDYGVDVPLWGEDGLIFVDQEELRREWDLSDELVSHMVKWALAWESNAGQPEHDAEAARLVRSLKRELDHRYQVVFHP